MSIALATKGVIAPPGIGGGGVIIPSGTIFVTKFGVLQLQFTDPVGVLNLDFGNQPVINNIRILDVQVSSPIQIKTRL